MTLSLFCCGQQGAGWFTVGLAHSRAGRHRLVKHYLEVLFAKLGTNLSVLHRQQIITVCVILLPDHISCTWEKRKTFNWDSGLQFQRFSPLSLCWGMAACRQTWCWRGGWEFCILQWSVSLGCDLPGTFIFYTAGDLMSSHGCLLSVFLMLAGTAFWRM